MVKVARAQGTVVYSSDHELIKAKLKQFFVSSIGRSTIGVPSNSTKLEDGRYVTELRDPDWLPYFRPRVEDSKNIMKISDLYCREIKGSAPGDRQGVDGESPLR